MTNGSGGLLATDDAFKSLGLNPDYVEPWEDGRRLREPCSEGSYEWWYCDAHLNDGYFCVASHHIDIGPGGENRPFVNLNIVKDGKVLCDAKVPVAIDQCSFSEDKCDAVLGSHFFRSVEGLSRYHVRVDPSQTGGFGLDLTFESVVPAYRPGTGHLAVGDRYFAWLAAVPGATVNGQLYVADQPVQVTGNGYHDHNWGNVPIDHLISDWLWGRAEVDGKIVIASATNLRPEFGSFQLGALYMAEPGRGLLVDAYGDEVVCLDGAGIAQPDTGKRISSDCIYFAKNGENEISVRFDGRGNVISSFPFANSSSEWETWSTRYGAVITIDERHADGRTTRSSGPGTLENLDFFARRVKPRTS